MNKAQGEQLLKVARAIAHQYHRTPALSRWSHLRRAVQDVEAVIKDIDREARKPKPKKKAKPAPISASTDSAVSHAEASDA